MEQQQGLIAILYALGAANYSDDAIKQFMRSRETVLNLLNRKAKDVRGDIDDPERLQAHDEAVPPPITE